MALLPFRRDVLHGRGQKVDGFEDLEVALGMPAPSGAINDLLGFFVPRDLFEREGLKEQLLTRFARPSGCHSADYVRCSPIQPSVSTIRHHWGDGFFPGIEAEAAVGPGKELAAFAENAAERPRHGENELPVRPFKANLEGDPVSRGADAALVASPCIPGWSRLRFSP